MLGAAMVTASANITNHTHAGKPLNDIDATAPRSSLSGRLIPFRRPPPPPSRTRPPFARAGPAARFGLEEAELERRALQWSQLRGGRSGRVAWQFVRELAGEKGVSLPL